MNYKVPGLVSIILFFIAIGIAVFQLFSISITLGITYLVLLPFGFLILLYSYCRKCPHAANRTCRHVLFGWLVSKIYTPCTPTKYSFKEIVLALLPLAILVTLPQYFLFQRIGLFACFWILMLIAVIIVIKGVCPACQNTNCRFCPNKRTCRQENFNNAE